MQDENSLGDIVASVGILILGWLLGLLSPIIVDSIRRRSENNEVKMALKTELEELRFRLACIIHRIAMSFGETDRELLEWLKPIILNYKGLNPSENILESIEKLLSLSDQEIRSLEKQHAVAEVEHGLSLKKQLVPLLESKFALLSAFNTNLQNSLLEIRAHLNLLNEEVDEARYYFRLTFENSLSNENRSIIRGNLNGSYRSYSSQAKIIVKLISEVGW